MKVLMVTESYWPNADGAALFERRLVLGLIARGHHLAVWAPGHTWQRHQEIDGPYTIYRERALTFLANRKYKVSFWPFLEARRVIRRERPDLIHIHNCYLMGLSALFWARRYRIPVIATNHFMPENAMLNLHLPSVLHRPFERVIWAFLAWFHNRAKLVVSPTPTAARLLEDHGLHVPSLAITNGIDTEVFKPADPEPGLRQRLHIPTERPVVLYVGRVDGEKRLDLIVSALPEVLNEQTCTLVIAGFGKALDDLRSQATRLGVKDHIVFTGYLEEADKPHLYNDASVFVISSPAELQSIVTLEAMASGLPIVATDVAALSELCHDGVNGFLFEMGDTHTLARSIISLLADQKLRHQFGHESLKLINQHHSTRITFDEYERAYKQAVRGVTA